MLIGLAAKNAILIVEFAKAGHEAGLSLLEAAEEAARLRFRPILMTAFAFIMGAVPLMLASGSGAVSRAIIWARRSSSACSSRRPSASSSTRRCSSSSSGSPGGSPAPSRPAGRVPPPGTKEGA